VSIADAALAATALSVALRLLRVCLWLSVWLLAMLLAFLLSKGGDRSQRYRGHQSEYSEKFFHS
jgi:hypothetical protein